VLSRLCGVRGLSPNSNRPAGGRFFVDAWCRWAGCGKYCGVLLEVDLAYRQTLKKTSAVSFGIRIRRGTAIWLAIQG
jgi:hypothetical protein